MKRIEDKLLKDDLKELNKLMDSLGKPTKTTELTQEQQDLIKKICEE